MHCLQIKQLQRFHLLNNGYSILHKASAVIVLYSTGYRRGCEKISVSIHVKCKVYKNIVLSSPRYKAETCTLSKAQIDKLHAYMMRQMQQIIKYYSL